MSTASAVEYARAASRRLKTRFGTIVQRGTASAAGNGATVLATTYDGTDLSAGVGLARLRGAEINAGDTVWLLNTTPGDPEHAMYLVLGAEGGLARPNVYSNAWAPGGEPSTTNSATPVACVTQTWALPSGTYTLVLTGQAGMRNNGSTDNLGYLALRVDGTIIGEQTQQIATSSGAEPVVRAPVAVAGVVGNKSGTVTIELLFRNDSGVGVTVWAYCPLVTAVAQRTA